MIQTVYKTPKDLKIPCCNLETGTLELIVLPSDLVAATEVVASAVELGAAKNITILGDVKNRNGPVSVFFRKKCNVREKAILHAMQNDKYIPLAAVKLSRLLNKALAKEALGKLELVGLQHLTPEALSCLAEGISGNMSLTALCLNDSTIGDKGLLQARSRVKLSMKHRWNVY